MVESVVKKNKDLIETLRNYIKNEKLDFSTISDQLYAKMAYDQFEKYYQIIGDETAPNPSDRIKIDYLVNDGATPSFKEALKSYGDDLLNSIKSDPINFLSFNILSNEEEVNLLKSEFSNFIVKYKKNSMAFPETEQNEIKTLEKDFQKIITGKDPMKVHLSLFALGKYKTYLYSNNILPPCQKKECREEVLKKFKSLNFKEIIENFEKENSIESILESKMNECESAYNFVIQKEKTLDNLILKIIPEAKKKIISNFFKDKSSKSKRKFKDYLDNHLEILFPQNTFSKFFNGLDFFQMNFFENPSTQKSLSAKEATSFLIQNINLNSLDPAKELNFCDTKSFFSEMQDQFIPKDSLFLIQDDPFYEFINDSVSVSFETLLKNENVAKSILIHELGHSLNFMLSKNKLSKKTQGAHKKTRECIDSFYIQKNNSIISLNNLNKNENFKTEEDTADFISYIALPDYEKHPYTCNLLLTEGNKYLNIFKDHFSQDSHSSPILRILREVIEKKKTLPQSCQNFVQENKDTYRFKSCNTLK